MNKFVLVVENSRHANYFTEKLLDAVLARCVPIYWGCDNLDDFFDLQGIIMVRGGLEEVCATCSSLTEGDYHSRLEALDCNAERAAAYAGDFGQRVQRALEECLPSFGAKAPESSVGGGGDCIDRATAAAPPGEVGAA